MMNEVMRLTTFFATLSLMSLFATSLALAAAGATNTTGVPLLCRDCAQLMLAKSSQPDVANWHARRAAGRVSKTI